MLSKIKWRLEWKRDFYNMKKIETFPDLYLYAENHNSNIFDEFEKSNLDPTHNERRTTGEQFNEMLKYFNIDLSGKSVLELGPGWGEFLTLSNKLGAKETNFIDYHPYYFTYCRLLGYKGYVNDYFSKKAFKGVPKNKYDLIVSRGSINVDRFERQYNGSFRLVSFPDWLNNLEQLATSNATIIICPTYDLGFEHDYRYLKITRRKVFEHLLYKGYKVVHDIPVFSHPLYFPYTFVKGEEIKNERTST